MRFVYRKYVFDTCTGSESPFSLILNVLEACGGSVRLPRSVLETYRGPETPFRLRQSMLKACRVSESRF